MLFARREATLLLLLSLAACSDVRVVPDDPQNEEEQASTSVGSTSSATSSTAATGAGGAGGEGGEGGGGGPPGQVPGIVAVGYGNLRVVSRDDGVSWSNRVVDGDPNSANDILWSVAWGAGRWVAVGERMLTSVDGVVWTDDTASMPCTMAEGVAHFQDELWMGCDTLDDGPVVFRSADGLTWGDKTPLDIQGIHVFLFAQGGKLVAHGDAGSVVSTEDGQTWQTMQGLDWPAYCNGRWMEASACGPDSMGASWFDGTWLAAAWPGTIRRSLDGVSYADVYVDDEGYTVFDSRAFARGWVAAE